MHFNGKCPICLGEFLPEQISALRCGHTFHYECILQWLQTSRTCPECRLQSTERNMIRQLYFNTGDVSQFLNTSATNNEESLQRRIIELKQALAQEQTAHGKTMEELQTTKKLKEKYEALYTHEKLTKKKLTSQLARLEQMELMLQEKQHLQRQLDQSEARLRASEMYSALSGSDESGTLAKIDKYLNERGEPDTSKFIELMKKQHAKTAMMLRETRCQSEADQKKILDLRKKLDEHKRLTVALKEEVSNLRGNSSQPLSNPKLKAVLACSSDGPRTSFGFEPDENDSFSPGLMKSALKARSRPKLYTIGCSKKPTLAPFLFEDDDETTVPSNSAGVSKVVTQADDEAKEMSPDNWDVRVPEAVIRRVHLPSPKKKSNGLGGIAKPPLRPIEKVSTKRPFPASSGKTLTKQKSSSNVAGTRSVATFFTKNPRNAAEAPPPMDESVICLDD